MQYKFSKEIARQLLTEAMELSYSVKVDELDCSKSCCRVATDKTPIEVLEIGLNDKYTLYSFIYRRNYGYPKDYFELGLSTMLMNPDYFLWIRLSIEDGNNLAKKYKLSKYD
jgi:hypothetical protein